MTPWSRVFLETLIVAQLGKKYPRLLWNLKAHYHVHKSPTQNSILNQLIPIHSFSIYYSKIHSYITFPSAVRSSEWSHPFRFSDQNFVCLSHQFHACYMLHLSHPYLFYHPNNIWWIVQFTKPPVSPSASGPDILSTLFSSTLNLW